MEISEAFAPTMGIDAFFHEALVALHGSRPGEFETLSAVPIIICVKFDDGRVFSVLADKTKVEIEDDEAIDFPLATIFGRVEDWQKFQAWVLRYTGDYERRKSELAGVFRFTSAFAQVLEKYDVAASFTLTDLDGQTMAFEIVLNNYEVSDANKTFSLAVDVGVLDEIASGSRTPADVAKGLKISGDYGIAAELGALLLKFRP